MVKPYIMNNTHGNMDESSSLNHLEVKKFYYQEWEWIDRVKATANVLSFGADPQDINRRNDESNEDAFLRIMAAKVYAKFENGDASRHNPNASNGAARFSCYVPAR